MLSDLKQTALIFGASGIVGWPLMRECLSYPSSDTFSRIIALTRRPLNRDAAFIPDDPRLELYSGFDLSNEDEIKQKLERIKDINGVTHVYFVAYTGHGSNLEELKRVNVEIIENALKSLNKLCPKLEIFMLQTGGKGYGMEGAGWPPAPWKETLPRLPEPYASKIFYYAQYDIVAKYASNSSWKFCDVRPAFLQGFVPHHNSMNISQTLGLFLSLYRSKNGVGAECVFPGSKDSWTALHTDGFQDLIARFHIYASMNPTKVHARSFNIGDGESVTWEQKWPILCSYFGLKGVGPSEARGGELSGVEWVMTQRDYWATWVHENGLTENALEGTTWDILTTAMSLPIRTDYDLSACREIGFQETMEPAKGYMLAFERMKRAKILP